MKTANKMGNLLGFFGASGIGEGVGEGGFTVGIIVFVAAGSPPPPGADTAEVPVPVGFSGCIVVVGLLVFLTDLGTIFDEFGR